MRVFIGLLVLAACDKGGAPPPPNLESPRTAAEATVTALMDPSGARLAAVLPSEDALQKTFDCPNGEMVKVRKTLAAPPAPAEGTTLRLGAFDQQGTEEKLVKSGESFGGCQVKLPVNVHRSKLVLDVVRGAKTDYQDAFWTFFQFGAAGSWYYFRL